MTWDPKSDGLPQISGMIAYVQSVSFYTAQ